MKFTITNVDGLHHVGVVPEKDATKRSITPFKGLEMICDRYDMPVVFGSIAGMIALVFIL